jgi:hypothetical protein
MSGCRKIDYYIGVCKTRPRNHFLGILLIRFCFGGCDAKEAVVPFCTAAPTLALGLSGDNVPGLGVGTAVGLSGSSPVTLLRSGVRPTAREREALSVPGPLPPNGSLASIKSEGVEVSVPSACRRAFSCLAWTNRKCDKSSCHLISSRPILDLVVNVPTVLSKQPSVTV